MCVKPFTCAGKGFFVAKALQAKNVLAQFFICRAQEQREAMLRAVSVRNRVGVAYSIGERYEKNMDVYQGI